MRARDFHLRIRTPLPLEVCYWKLAPILPAWGRNWSILDHWAPWVRVVSPHGPVGGWLFGNPEPHPAVLRFFRFPGDIDTLGRMAIWGCP